MTFVPVAYLADLAVTVGADDARDLDRSEERIVDAVNVDQLAHGLHLGQGQLPQGMWLFGQRAVNDPLEAPKPVQASNCRVKKSIPGNLAEPNARPMFQLCSTAGGQRRPGIGRTLCMPSCRTPSVRHAHHKRLSFLCGA
jgi:hypothetical protein